MMKYQIKRYDAMLILHEDGTWSSNKENIQYYTVGEAIKIHRELSDADKSTMYAMEGIYDGSD